MTKQTCDQLVFQIGELLIQSHAMLATAESCTGGWIAQQITALPGSSNWFDRGFVTYSNVSKTEMLGVSDQTIRLRGAVSEQTVCEMAQGALSNSHADWSLAVSGVAGPGGGTEENPVGNVWFAWASKEGYLRSELRQLEGDRVDVRGHAVINALVGLMNSINGE